MGFLWGTKWDYYQCINQIGPHTGEWEHLQKTPPANRLLSWILPALRLVLLLLLLLLIIFIFCVASCLLLLLLMI